MASAYCLLPGSAGDIIRFKRTGYWHFAVKMDDQNVIHLTGDFPGTSAQSASSTACNPIVKVQSYSEVVKGSTNVEVCNRYDGEHRPFSPSEIVNRAWSQVGRACYHLLRQNCEHFANWCRYGISKSHQGETFVTVAALGVGVVAAFFCYYLGSSNTSSIRDRRK